MLHEAAHRLGHGDRVGILELRRVHVASPPTVATAGASLTANPSMRNVLSLEEIRPPPETGLRRVPPAAKMPHEVKAHISS
jgi:hypothetical protein